jgi:hypothetical protein
MYWKTIIKHDSFISRLAIGYARLNLATVHGCLGVPNVCFYTNTLLLQERDESLSSKESYPANQKTVGFRVLAACIAVFGRDL